LYVFSSICLFDGCGFSSMKARRSTNSPKFKTNIYCRCCVQLSFRNWSLTTSRNRFIDAELRGAKHILLV
jgi:hypothetical protein